MTRASATALRSEQSVPLHYIGQLCQYLAEQGIDTEQWLQGLGLSDHDLLSEDSRLAPQDYFQLIQSAATLAPHPYFGLEVGARLRVHNHGLLGLAVMNCRTLQQVLELFCRYIAIRTPLVGLQISEVRGKVVCGIVELVPMVPIRVYFIEALLATFYQLFKELAGHDRVFEALALPYTAPDYAAHYQQVFACDVRFGAKRCEVTLDKNVLAAPLGLPDQQVLADTIKLCDQQLARVDQDVSYGTVVRRMLMNSPESLPDTAQVARQMNLTKRTLHRYLAKEGTGYQTILDEVRAHLAGHYLKDCGHSVKTCGFLLGYADVANFRRAFKRWYGLPPADWQTQQTGEQD